MKRLPIILLFLCAAAGFLSAQADEYPDGETVSDFDYLSIRKGDQFIKLGLGVNIPLLMQGPDGAGRAKNMYVGGVGCLGYHYYITPGFSLGGDINFQFNVTTAGNVLFKLPILIKPAWTFTLGRIHIPVSLGLGATFESYDSRNYFNVSVQPEVGAYYIFNPEWSFGLAVSWDVIPQWYKDSSNNRIGHFLNTCISLRYHF
ncbi:MAG: hypothetical protein IAA96_02735 [Spirochaetes bacterium]|uniref:Outer membrane protein beta-barrel domain-containing protein n=1 Tax=Candidatus Avitreponema avistercoris TaxID=2840705 RepID=A0A9D9HDA8_9SPIR|nr:hypothetical protein [Candidatus Avitreponema avistercoris]